MAPLQTFVLTSDIYLVEIRIGDFEMLVNHGPKPGRLTYVVLYKRNTGAKLSEAAIFLDVIFDISRAVVFNML